MDEKKPLPLEEIARRLKELRGETPVSEVSIATGIGVSALNNYEAALRFPRDEAKAKLASYYARTVDDIFFSG